jgi:hypothetical protein
VKGEGRTFVSILQLGIQRGVSIGGMPNVPKHLPMVVGSWVGLAMFSNRMVHFL